MSQALHHGGGGHGPQGGRAELWGVRISTPRCGTASSLALLVVSLCARTPGLPSSGNGRGKPPALGSGPGWRLVWRQFPPPGRKGGEGWPASWAVRLGGGWGGTQGPSGLVLLELVLSSLTGRVQAGHWAPWDSAPCPPGMSLPGNQPPRSSVMLVNMSHLPAMGGLPWLSEGAPLPQRELGALLGNKDGLAAGQPGHPPCNLRLQIKRPQAGEQVLVSS